MINLKKIKSALIRNKLKIVLFLIIILGIFLRFYNYDNRFGIAADQARDILIVREALSQHTLPLIGPFSAAGSFVFGPFWYWIFMLPIALFPNSLLAPWIFQSILYVFIVPIMFFTGKKLINERLGLLLSFFTAISAKEVTLSTNLIISALVGFFAFVVFYLFIKFLKERKSIFIYVIAFLIGFLINTHFEAIPLVCLLPVLIFLSKNRVKDLLYSIFFFCIPFTPLFIFNLNSNFYESSNIFNLHQQAPNGRTIIEYIQAWFNFGFNFIPRVWRDVIGSNIFVTNLFLTIGIALNAVYIMRRKIPKEILVIFFSFFLMLFFLLFYKGRIFENFMSFIFPFILFITSYTCFTIFKKNKILGALTIIILSSFTLSQDYSLITTAVNNTSDTANYFKDALVKKYPNKNFSLYNYNNINNDIAYSLSLYLDLEGKISDNGQIIGLANVGAPINHQIIILNKKMGLTMYSLTGTNVKQNGKQNFLPVNPKDIYDSTENWYKN